MPAHICFKAKIRQSYNVGGSLHREYAQVPVFTSAHYSIAKFRTRPKYAGIANSALFSSALKRIRRSIIGSDCREHIYMDALPENVAVDRSGFLAVFTIVVADR